MLRNFRRPAQVDTASLHLHTGNIVSVLLVAGLLLHPVIDDLYAAHGQLFHSAVDDPGVLFSRDAVDKISSDKAQGAHTLVRSSRERLIFSRLQIHQVHRLRIVPLSALLPRDQALIAADGKGALLQRVGDHHALPALKINPIDRVIHIQIEHSRAGLAGEAGKVILKRLKGAVIGNIVKFLQRIFIRSVAVTRNPHLPLMVSPVHIAKHHKIYVSGVLHRENADIMLTVIIADIIHISVAEGENPDRLPLPLHIAPQIPVRAVSDHLALRALHRLHLIIIRDAEHDPLSDKVTPLSLKYLIDLTLIIHHISPGLVPFHSEIFFFMLYFFW